MLREIIDIDVYINANMQKLSFQKIVSYISHSSLILIFVGSFLSVVYMNFD